MSKFVLHSNHAGDQLEIWIVKPGDEWRARIDFGDLTAEARFYERYSREELELDHYFADLAAHWKGWQGDKSWEALGLQLAARHDGLGHVTVAITLYEDYAAADRWEVRASLELDAGRLDPLARAAQALDAR